MSVFFQKLYVRIWLAVVGTVAVLTMLVGFVWRLAAEPPLREVVVRDAQGQVIGAGQRQPGPPPWVRPHGAGDATAGGPPPAPSGDGPPPRGPEFVVLMHDGRTLHMHLPRPPRNSWQAPLGFAWTLGLVALAVALATYPIVRRLTRNLEQLQRGVQRLGEGDLKVRVAVKGHDEVAFLAERFNQSAERIAALVQSQANVLDSQKALLANASHELRSPLARIRMGLELLGLGEGGTGNEALRDELVRNIAELDSLVDELLLASRLDAQQADLGTVEPVDFAALVVEECARSGIALDVALDDGAGVRGVAALLRRMVRNLLQSSQRAPGPLASQARLSRDGDQILLGLWDPALQLTLQQLEQPFQPFWRAPGASERDGGVGLALALVRAIAQRSGGSATARQAEAGGTWFEVRLPLDPPRTLP